MYIDIAMMENNLEVSSETKIELPYDLTIPLVLVLYPQKIIV